jgi:hypothetical protein
MAHSKGGNPHQVWHSTNEMAVPSYTLQGAAGPAKPTSGFHDARPAMRAPRPQSWSPPLPPHRIPIPPPPLSNQQPFERTAAQIAAPLSVPAAPASSAAHRRPPEPLRVPVVQLPQPARLPPPTIAPISPVAPFLEEDSDSPSGEFLRHRRQLGMGWPYVALLGAAALVVSIFVVAQFRPDIAARVVESFRGSDTQSTAALTTSSMSFAPPAETPLPARQGAAVPAAGRTNAGPEPPVVSVWSLPVARVGGPQPQTPMPVFHAVGAAPPPAAHDVFVPGAAYAFSFNSTPKVSPPPNLPATPNVVPPSNFVASPPAAVEPPAPKATLPQKAVQATNDAPASNPAPPPPLAAPAPPPRPVAPAPPPKPRFAPGSLEDQIQKAVEAEANKKK